jgi:hypothetical protein
MACRKVPMTLAVVLEIQYGRLDSQGDGWY